MTLMESKKKICEELVNEYMKSEEKLKALQHMLNEATEQVAVAKSHGDLRENYAYHDALGRKRNAESSLRELSTWRNIYEEFSERLKDSTDSKYISTGTAVQLKYEDGSNKITNIMLVPANLGEAKIGAVSIASPVGKALLGCTKGAKVTVTTSIKEVEYLIMDIC